MVPALAHKGVYRWRCCVRGHAAHSSLTPQSVNAIEVGARVVGKLADMAKRWRDGAALRRLRRAVHDRLGRRDRRRHRRQHRARRCRFRYEFRNLPGTEAAEMQGEVLAFAAPLEAGDARGRARGRHPLRDDLRDAVVPGPRRRPGRAAGRGSPASDETTLVAFGTEAGLFQKAGIPTVVCGPGHIAQAHQADEYVALEQLAAGERFLKGLMTLEVEALG